MEKKTANSETNLPILPDDLIVEQILPRLPVKSLIRFKSVSKYWFSTISSHKFQKTHLKFSSYCPQVLMLENGYLDGKNYLLSLDECSNVKELVDFGCKYPGDILSECYITRVKGSINGLLCLYDNSDEVFPCFYLWNPATQQCSKVGSPYVNHPNAWGVAGSGIGYISSIDDYRIGCISEKDEKGRHVDVFSLRTGKWKRTTTLDENYYFSLNYQGFSVSIDDTIYWPPRVSSGGNDDKSHILGLNLVSGQLTKISLKNVISGYDEVGLFRTKGCLSLGCISYLKGCDICDVLMLKQHDDCTSWEKIFSLDTGDTNLLYLFEMGKCLLGEYPEELKLLDPSKVGLEECEENNPSKVGLEECEQNTIIWQGSEHIGDSLSEACGYVESLISPFGTTKYDEDEDDHEIKE